MLFSSTRLRYWAYKHCLLDCLQSPFSLKIRLVLDLIQRDCKPACLGFARCNFAKKNKRLLAVYCLWTFEGLEVLAWTLSVVGTVGTLSLGSSLKLSYTFRNFTLSALVVASHADVLSGSSRVPAPRTSADLSEKKKRLMGWNARRTPKNVCVGGLPKLVGAVKSFWLHFLNVFWGVRVVSQQSRFVA